MMGKLSAYGDCIASICPEASWPHLADAGTSTMLAGDPAAELSVVSFSELLLELL